MGEAYIDHSPDQVVRDGIEAMINLDVIIGVNLGALPFGVFKGLVRQRAKGPPSQSAQTPHGGICQYGAWGDY